LELFNKSLPNIGITLLQKAVLEKIRLRKINDVSISIVLSKRNYILGTLRPLSGGQDLFELREPRKKTDPNFWDRRTYRPPFVYTTFERIYLECG
jgi:hypothetical protein